MPLNLTRSLLTVILPGFVAVGPWLLLAIMWFPDVHDWYKKFAMPIHFAAFGLVVTVGCAFEELGSYLEKKWDAAMAAGGAPEFEDNWVNRDWYSYLRAGFGNGEPVAYRYLSRKVTALYFELGMMWATPVALIAIALIVAKLLPGAIVIPVIVGSLSGLWLAGLYVAAKHTHQLLCEVRHFVANPSLIPAITQQA